MKTRSASSAAVSEVLDDVDNYLDWSVQVKTYLIAQDLWDIIEPTKPEKVEAAFKAWTKKNAQSLHMIQLSCGPRFRCALRMITSAKTAWDALEKICSYPKSDYEPASDDSDDSDGSDDSDDESHGDWSKRMESYLREHDLLDIVKATTNRPTLEDDGIAFKDWSMKNALALYLILASSGSKANTLIGKISEAKLAWETLARECDRDSDVGDLSQYVSFRKDVQEGNWDAANVFLSSNPEAVTAKISDHRGTALHIAINARHMNIVKGLVNKMSKEDLTIEDKYGYTVLDDCAQVGNIEMAKCIIEKNRTLLDIRKDDGPLIPVLVAIRYNPNAINMVHYLYAETPRENLMPGKGINGATFITGCIYAKAFDMALDLLRHYPALVFAQDFNDQTPLLALASVSFAHPSGNQLIFWKQWIYDNWWPSLQDVPSAYATDEVSISIQDSENGERGQVRNIGSDVVGAGNGGVIGVELAPVVEVEPVELRRIVTAVIHLNVFSVKNRACGFVSNLLKPLGINEIYKLKLLHHQSKQLLIFIRESVLCSSSEKVSDLVKDALIKAVKKGMVEFVDTILKADQTYGWTSEDITDRNIFMLAVTHRQNEVFELLCRFHLKNARLSDVTKDNSNILHIAGILEPSARPNTVPGAAFLMQREVQWFKKVKSIVQPFLLEAENKNGHTPGELFKENHKEMVKEGEKWMKETETSCTVAGALIVTIMFAAAITVPGGNNQNTGLPMFFNEKLFVIFIIFDALSLLSASTSLLIFIGILTARYVAENFLESLPKKMIIGLSTLLLSIASMMITFCASLFIILPGKSRIVIPLVCLASVPVVVFAWMQFRLLIDMFNSTYRSKIFNKKMKHEL